MRQTVLHVLSCAKESRVSVNTKINKTYLMTGISTVILLVSLIMPIGFLGLTREAVVLCGIFFACLVLWLTVSIDWPSILCIGLLALLPSVGMGEALKGSFANTIFAFLLMTFICTYALSQTPFLKRVAVNLLDSPLAQKGQWYFYIMFILSVYLIGLFVSPTILFVIFLPIMEEICALLNLRKGDRTAQFFAISMIIAIALSAGATPISHVFATVAMGFYEQAVGTSISYGQYIAVAMPITLVLLAALVVIGKYVYKPDLSQFQHINIKPMKLALPQVSKREMATVGIFLFVVILWLAPDFFKVLFPEAMAKLKSLTTAFPPLVGVILLSVIHVNKTPLVELPQALSKGVHWPSLLMAGATLALSNVMISDAMGITAQIKLHLGQAASTLSPLMMIAFFVVWAAIQTNFSSNLVTVSMVSAIALPLIQNSGASNAYLALMSILIGLMASLAYATPPAMPYVAIIIGSQWASAKSVLKYGVAMMLVSILSAILIGYPIAMLLF